MKRIWLALAAAGILAGCTHNTPDQDLQAAANQQVICQGEQDCTYRWGRAQKWVIDNAAYRPRTVTDTFIDTVGPFPNESTSSAIQVFKSPLGSGKYQIEFKSWCDNTFGCAPGPVNMKASFNTFVLQGTP